MFHSGVVVAGWEVVVAFEEGLKTSGVVGVGVQFKDFDGDAAASGPEQVIVG